MEWVNGRTKLIAIIGNPIGHSLSPLMHNTAFNELGLNYAYVPLEVKKGELDEAIKGLRYLGFQGANITIPYKEDVIQYLSGVSHEAQLIGAVNTLICNKDGFWGDNTDGKGFVMSIKNDLECNPLNKKVVILGAGGSARAVAISLALEGAEEIILINRNLMKAKAITDTIYETSGVTATAFSWETPFIEEVIKGSDIIINTTPLGMIPNIEEMPPINPEWLTPEHVVIDLIYNPIETKLLYHAKKRGCKVGNGLGMLVYQGALAFKLWTGNELPIAMIKNKLENYLLSINYK